MVEEAKTTDIALLVVGDPFGATTHADLVLRAKAAGTPVKIIHNVSIVNAVGCCGLQVSLKETNQKCACLVAVVLLRRNRLHRDVDRLLAAGLLLRQDCEEPRERTAHSLPAGFLFYSQRVNSFAFRHQNEGTVGGEPHEVGGNQHGLQPFEF